MAALPKRIVKETERLMAEPFVPILSHMRHYGEHHLLIIYQTFVLTYATV